MSDNGARRRDEIEQWWARRGTMATDLVNAPAALERPGAGHQEIPLMPAADYRRIPLRRRDGSVRAYALVDEGDYEWLSAWRWHLSPQGRAQRGENFRKPDGRRSSRFVLMHRAIMGLQRGDPREVDHKNHAGLDNRRENLRVVTHAQNGQNRKAGYGASRHRGVYWDAANAKWRAYLMVGGRGRNLGRFADEETAAAVVAEARRNAMPFSSEGSNA